MRLSSEVTGDLDRALERGLLSVRGYDRVLRLAWTEADAERFSEHFEQLPADQRMELLRKFSVAVNQGRLVPQTDRMPF